MDNIIIGITIIVSTVGLVMAIKTMVDTRLIIKKEKGKKRCVTEKNQKNPKVKTS